MNRRSVGCSLAGALVLVCPLAIAQAPASLAGSTRLDYQRAAGAESCPDEAGFREAVAAHTNGADPFAPNGPIVLRVMLAPLGPGAGFRGTMELFDAAGRPAGTDTRQASTCASAARALAFSASGLFLAPPAAPAPAVTTPPPLTPAPPLPPPPLPPKLPPAVRVQLGAGALVGFGFAPNPSAGFGGFVGLRFPRSAPAFELTIEGRGDLDSSGDVVALAKAPAQARAGFVGGSLAPCGFVRWFFGCALVTLGAVRGSAGDAYEPAEQTSLFAGLGGRIGAELWIVEGPPAFGVRLAFDGLFALSRPEVIAGGERIWTAPIGAGVASAHLTTRF